MVMCPTAFGSRQYLSAVPVYTTAMGNAASSGGKWDLSQPQPKWTPKKAAAAPRSIWLANKDKDKRKKPITNSNSNSNNDDNWFIFKAPAAAASSPKRSSKR